MTSADWLVMFDTKGDSIPEGMLESVTTSVGSLTAHPMDVQARSCRRYSVKGCKPDTVSSSPTPLINYNSQSDYSNKDHQ